MAVVPFPDPQNSKDSSAHDESDRWSQHDPEEVAGGKMSFLEHLDELRKRLIYALVSLGIGVGIAAIFIERIYQFVMRPMQQMLPPGGKLIYTEGPEAFMLYIRIAIIAGLVIAAPLIMIQLWLFISPALFPKERRFAIPFVVLASVGFIGGAAFSHYLVFPVMWRFFAGFSNDFVTFEPRVEPAFDLYIKMLLAMALVFQMPDGGAVSRAVRAGDGPDDDQLFQVRDSRDLHPRRGDHPQPGHGKPADCRGAHDDSLHHQHPRGADLRKEAKSRGRRRRRFEGLERP